MRGIAKTNNEVNKRLKEEQNGQVRFGQKEKKIRPKCGQFLRSERMNANNQLLPQ